MNLSKLYSLSIHIHYLPMYNLCALKATATSEQPDYKELVLHLDANASQALVSMRNAH